MQFFRVQNYKNFRHASFKKTTSFRFAAGLFSSSFRLLSRCGRRSLFKLNLQSSSSGKNSFDIRQARRAGSSGRINFGRRWLAIQTSSTEIITSSSAIQTSATEIITPSSEKQTSTSGKQTSTSGKQTPSSEKADLIV